MIIITVFTIITFASCEKLALQKSYDYEGQAIDPHVNMTTWQFMQSRPDVFSLMSEAIEYAGMKSVYEQTDTKYTYLLINIQG